MDFNPFGKKKPAPAQPAAPVDDPIARARAALAASKDKYGGTPPVEAAPAAPAAPAPTIQGAAAPAPTIQGAAAALMNRREAIDKAVGLKDGGIVEKKLLRQKAAVKQKRGC